VATRPAAMRFPRVRKPTVAVMKLGQLRYLFTTQPKRRVATKLAGTPAARASGGFVAPIGRRNSMSPMKLPMAAPTATEKVSETTAKKRGTKEAM